MAEGLIINAGTINPHEPKRVIASSMIGQWIEDTPMQRRPDEP
jgi:hypothetical protein